MARAEQCLRLVEVPARCLPDGLMFRRRRAEHETRTQHVERSAHVRKGCPGVFAAIEIDATNFTKALVRAACSAIFPRIHANGNYVELEGVFIDLELEGDDPSFLGSD